MTILTPQEIFALRALCRARGRTASPATRSALDKLFTIPPGCSVRLSVPCLRRLSLAEEEQRAALGQRLEPIRQELLKVATEFGAADPGAADTGELLYELEDATVVSEVDS